MPREMESPVRNYSDMEGWPGTMPVARLQAALKAIRERVPQDDQDAQIRQDILSLSWAEHANLFSSKEPVPPPTEDGTEAQRHLSSVQNLDQLIRVARAQDTMQSIGGIIIWKRETTEDRVIFQLRRHPEIIGLNRILPLMSGMNVMIFESQAVPENAGLIMAQSRWDKNERDLGVLVPPGHTTPLQKLLEWHGAQECRWISRNATMR